MASSGEGMSFTGAGLRDRGRKMGRRALLAGYTGGTEKRPWGSLHVTWHGWYRG